MQTIVRKDTSLESQFRNSFDRHYPSGFLGEVIISVKWGTLTQFFEKGFKYCSTCRVLLETEEIHCPVCRRKMRTKTRSKTPDRYNETTARPQNRPQILNFFNPVTGENRTMVLRK